MPQLNHFFGILNIAGGVVFILISIPLVAQKIKMNRLYGFRLPKAFASEENWYEINRYGGRQLIFWSSFLIIIGLLYFIFPVKTHHNSAIIILLATAPIVICTTVAIIKTVIFSKGL